MITNSHLLRRLRGKRFAGAFGERGDAVEGRGGEEFGQAGGPAYFDFMSAGEGPRPKWRRMSLDEL